MSNIQPSPLDISPRLRLGLILRGEGCIFAIYTEKTWYILYSIVNRKIVVQTMAAFQRSTHFLLPTREKARN